MTKFRGAMNDLLKVDSYFTQAPIQGARPWQGQNVPSNGGGGGGNNKPPNGHLGGPFNIPPSEHSGNPFIGLIGGHFGGISSGPPSRPPNRPSNGPLGGPLNGFPLGPYLGTGLPYSGTFAMGTQTGHPWKPWVPTWYPTPIVPTTSAHISRKSLPYPIYIATIDPNTHVQVFQKVIQANDEKNDANIVNLFCFTVRDAILRWGENFMQSHSRCYFVELEITFC